MILETQRIVADWLGRKDLERTHGVNDLLLSVDRDDRDDLPTPLQGVWDETRDIYVAGRKDPPNTPAIYVMQDSPFEMQGEVMTTVRDTSDLVLAIRYLTTAYDNPQGVQDTHYTLRAVTKSLKQLSENSNSSARTRNNVCLESFTHFIQVPVSEAVGSSRVTGGLLVGCEVRDAAP